MSDDLSAIFTIKVNIKNIFLPKDYLIDTLKIYLEEAVFWAADDVGNMNSDVSVNIDLVPYPIIEDNIP